MKTRRGKRQPPQIPLASMSDVAFLLLIFFVLTARFIVQRSLDSELPAITPDKTEASEDLITVLVKNDHVYLDDERVSLEELAPFLAAKLAGRDKPEDRAVLLDGEETVRYELIARAANEIKRAGGIVTMMKVEE